MPVMQPQAQGRQYRRSSRHRAYFAQRDIEIDSDSESDDDGTLQSIDDDSDDDDDDDKGITGNAAATLASTGTSTTATPTLGVSEAPPAASLSSGSSTTSPSSSSPTPPGTTQSVDSGSGLASNAPSSVATSVAQTSPSQASFSTILPISTPTSAPSGTEIPQAPVPRVSSTSSIPTSSDSDKDATLVLASDNRSQTVGIAMGTISAVIILLGLAYFLIWRKRRQQKFADQEPNFGPRRPAPSLVWTLWGSSPSARSGRTVTRSPGNRTNSDIIDEMVRTAYATEEGGNAMEGGFIPDEKRNFATFPREPPVSRRRKPRTISAWVRGLVTPRAAMSPDPEPRWERHLSLATRPLSSPGLSSAPTLETLSSASGSRHPPSGAIFESPPRVPMPVAVRTEGFGRE